MVSSRASAGGVLTVPRLRLPCDVDLDLPGSKSQANRLLVLAALSGGERRILHATACEDVVLMVEGLAALGFDVAFVDRDRGLIAFGGGARRRPTSVRLDCGLAGTTLRFLLPVACLVDGEVEIDGSERLRERPLAPLITALRSIGAEIEGDRLPLRVRGGRLRGGGVSIDASASSQFLSALLLVAPFVGEPMHIATTGPLASAGYIDATTAALRLFGFAVHLDDEGRRHVAPIRTRRRSALRVDADWSAAGFWHCLSRLTRSRFHDPRLERGGFDQPDRALPSILDAVDRPGDHEVDVAAVPDQVMNLAVYAARRSGRTRLVGARNLRLKESDRLMVTARELGRAGLRITEEPDGVLIEGGFQPNAARLDACGDHRLVMAYALLGSLVDGTEIQGADAVAKSYPHFFSDLARAQTSPRCIAVIGLRAAGKSVLGAALARRLDLDFVDTDTVVEARYRLATADFVRERGWDAFRAAEADAVASSLAPGRVVALGGGAVETDSVRRRLEDGAVVVFIDEDLAVLRARLAAATHRPSLTGLAVADEIDALAARRLPLMRGLAQVTLPAGDDVERRTTRCRAALASLCSW